jgi:glycolate oxidase FAD binding subunit
VGVTATAVDFHALCQAVAAAPVVVPVGARRHWEAGGPAPAGGVEVHAPGGVVAYDPEDLTVTVGAGVTVRELSALLGERGQECPLDPRDPDATVGGVLATGLSGLRRLRYGPVRDTVLELRFVTAHGRVVKGGGPTVKNVTGYDLPRLLVGSFGTLGVIAQVTLRCRPRPAVHTWYATERAAADVVPSLYRPSCVASDGTRTYVLLEGANVDVAAEAARAQLLRAHADDAVSLLPRGPYRGRISVPPSTLPAVEARLRAIDGCRWLAEYGVGTVHVACDAIDGARAARAVAVANGGWLLREAGGGDAFDGFGVALPNGELHARIKAAFDPDDRCNPGRLPA